MFDASTGMQLLLGQKTQSPFPERLEPSALQAYAAQSRPVVTALNAQAYQVILPIRAAGGAKVIVMTVLARFATGEHDTRQEIQRLETLCSLLLDRITSSSKKSTDSKPSDSQVCSVLAAYDVLFRNVRFHGESGRFQRHALKAVAEVVGAELALWVMGDKATVRLNRGTDTLSTWQSQQLVALLEERGGWDQADMLTDNAVGKSPIAAKFPQIHSLLAVRIRTDGQTGYVIAVNKIGAGTPKAEATTAAAAVTGHGAAGVAFTRGDAGLMASFSTLISAQARTAKRHVELKELIVGLTRALTSAIDAKDGYTAGHSERVARMGVELGKELGLAEEQLNDIYLAGLLHDVGKIGIRDEVLGKKGPLTPEEHDHIKEHPVIGHRILSGLMGIENLLGGVRHHHEQYNGRGYPDGLAGENIPRLARILAVADSFDAMSSDRPYRRGMPMEKIDQIFKEGRGEQWDPMIVDAYFKAKNRLREVTQRGIGESLREALDGIIRQEPLDDKASLVFAAR
jgi:HD-GYP domain-containing protein (c-di-GMP phosphodiesterase class II)